MTTKYWINKFTNNDYSEGDIPSSLHIEIPQRPDSTYDWDGAQWVQNVAKKIAQDSFNQDITDLAAIKGDNVLTTFVAMTPAQIDAWITANVTNLQTATSALRILAKIVLVIARRSLR